MNLNRIQCKDRGLLRELCKEEWGQITLRTVPPGEKAGGHSHPNTDERWWLLQGQAKVLMGNGGAVLIQNFTEDTILWVKAGTWHEIHNVGDVDVVFVFWSSKHYEEQEKS